MSLLMRPTSLRSDYIAVAQGKGVVKPHTVTDDFDRKPVTFVASARELVL